MRAWLEKAGFDPRFTSLVLALALLWVTLAPLSATYQRIGGGIQGSIGPLWSWLLGGLACAWVVAQAVYARRSRARYNAAMAPMWADAVKALVPCAALLGFVAVVCAYPD